MTEVEEKKFISNLKQNSRSQKIDLKGLDFPTSKSEFWKYTRTGKITNQVFSNVKSNKLQASVIEKYLEGYSEYIVFVNGSYNQDLSKFNAQFININTQIKNDQNIGKLTNAKDHIFSAINMNYFTDGVHVKVEKNVQLQNPILILHIASEPDAASILHHNINVQANSSVNFVFKTVNANSEEKSHFNIVNEIVAEENAHVQCFTIQEPNAQTSIIETTDVSIEKNANYSSFYISTGGNIIRNNINVKLNGEGAETHLYGLTLAKGKSHIDHHTLIDHRVPNCPSNEMYKTIVDDSATGVFNGKVFVRPDAQKTNAFQSSQGILLSDRANIYAKPELEIYADDVKCSHGSTTGQLDEEAKFYLKSRGIGEDIANKMLIKAFLVEVLDEIKNETTKNAFEDIIEQYFQTS